MSPVTRYKMRTKKEFLGQMDDPDLLARLLATVAHHYTRDVERIELYRDYRGWHLEATYKEEVK